MSTGPIRDRPYTQSSAGGITRRTFSGRDIVEEELRWHRDAASRAVGVVSGGGWQLQVEGGMPVDLRPGSIHFVPRGAWHRLLRSGSEDLCVLIREF